MDFFGIFCALYFLLLWTFKRIIFLKLWTFYFNDQDGSPSRTWLLKYHKKFFASFFSLLNLKIDTIHHIYFFNKILSECIKLNVNSKNFWGGPHATHYWVWKLTKKVVYHLVTHGLNVWYFHIQVHYHFTTWLMAWRGTQRGNMRRGILQGVVNTTRAYKLERGGKEKRIKRRGI